MKLSSYATSSREIRFKIDLDVDEYIDLIDVLRDSRDRERELKTEDYRAQMLMEQLVDESE